MTVLDAHRRGELLHAVFSVLAKHPDGLRAKDVLVAVEGEIELTEHERSNYPGTDVRRFEKTVRFQTIPAVKAGWLLKEKGTWQLTDDGVAAFAKYTDSDALYVEAVRLYRQWEKGQPHAPDAISDAEPLPSITVERAEETATEEVRTHLATMNPYDFQHLVAGLLRGMGYHIAWVAPPGKDRGVDIVAFSDPLGAHGPRIKVQVKREQTPTDVKGLRAFISVLTDRDVGMFVNLAGFTRDALDEGRHEQRLVTLLDADDLFKLWITYYDKLADEDRRRLPLRAVHYLALGEPQTD